MHEEISKKKNPLLREVKAINVGVHSFAEALEEQDVEVIHVDWRPPAGGDPHILELLRKFKK